VIVCAAGVLDSELLATTVDSVTEATPAEGVTAEFEAERMSVNFLTGFFNPVDIWLLLAFPPTVGAAMVVELVAGADGTVVVVVVVVAAGEITADTAEEDEGGKTEEEGIEVVWPDGCVVVVVVVVEGFGTAVVGFFNPVEGRTIPLVAEATATTVAAVLGRAVGVVVDALAVS